MKKSMKFIGLACAALCATTTFAGCLKNGGAATGGGNTSVNEDGSVTGGTLNIEYFQGGYGNEWLKKLEADYEAAYDCEVNLTAKPGVADDLQRHLKTGKNMQDIYFCQAGLNLNPLVKNSTYRSNLASLDDVYEKEVTKLDGTKVKIKDYMEDYAVSKYTFEKEYGSGEAHQWAMPWGSITIGMVVNLDMLEATKHKTAKAGAWEVGEAWTAAQLEESYSNLMLYYEELGDMSAAAEVVNAKRAAAGKEAIALDRFAKFGLNRTDSHWVQNAMYCWWAQYQGVYEMNEANGVTNGSFYDFFNWESVDVLKQEGLIKAMEMMQNMIVDISKKDQRGGAFKNIPNNYGELDLQRLEQNFMYGAYATMLAGSFFENESKLFNETGTRYQLISIPNCDEAQLGEDGKPISVTYNTINDCIVVPEKAPNLAHAKQFLAFMCNEKYLVDFAQKSGTLRPFHYNPVELTPEFAWSDYQKAIVKMNVDADYRIITYPVKAMQAGNVSKVATMYAPGMYGRESHTNVINYLKYLTVEEIMLTGGKNTANDINIVGAYNMTQKDWAAMQAGTL